MAQLHFKNISFPVARNTDFDFRQYDPKELNLVDGLEGLIMTCSMKDFAAHVQKGMIEIFHVDTDEDMKDFGCNLHCTIHRKYEGKDSIEGVRFHLLVNK